MELRIFITSIYGDYVIKTETTQSVVDDINCHLLRFFMTFYSCFLCAGKITYLSNYIIIENLLFGAMSRFKAN